MKMVICIVALLFCYAYAESVLRDVLKMSGGISPLVIEDARMVFGIACALLAGTYAALLGRLRR